MIRLPSRSFENFVFQISGLQKNQDPSFIFQKDRNQLLFNFEQIARCRNTFEICLSFINFLNNDRADIVFKIENENTMCVLFD